MPFASDPVAASLPRPVKTLLQKKPPISVAKGPRPGELPVMTKVIALKMRCTPKNVYEMARKGEIPSYRWGSTVSFYESEIDDWILDHRVG